MSKNKYFPAALLIIAVLLIAGLFVYSSGQNKDKEKKETETAVADQAEVESMWEEAAHTPLGKYPETVEYTLGKIAGSNNSNLPVGDTYEDNAYTRYLREVLNIQNMDIFELETDGSYEEALQVAIADREIPDVLVVNGWDNLERLVENGLVEDLTQVYEECTTDTIKEMYESYGDDLLDSATFDGKLYAFPNTAIDDGEMLLWLRTDWIEKLGLEEPQSMEEAMEIIREFVERDVSGSGQTVGLACSTEVIARFQRHLWCGRHIYQVRFCSGKVDPG